MDVHGMFLERETTDVTDFHRMVDGKGLRNPEKFFGGKEQVVFNLLSHALRWDILSIAFSCHGGETGFKDRRPNHKVKQRKSIHAIYLKPCSIIRMERKKIGPNKTSIEATKGYLRSAIIIHDCMLKAFPKT